MSAQPANLASWLVVVPARLGSERLPKKPLADLGGKPLIVRVCENLAPLAAAGARIVVATDAPSVEDACRAAGLDVAMTRADHPSGTDRCWEVASRHDAPFIMNVQGDEPFVGTDDLIGLAAAFAASAESDMGTLVFSSDDPKLALDPNAPKVVRSASGHALYFSRSLIPYDRDAKARAHVPVRVWLHLGIYAFRRPRLEAFVSLAPSSLEKTEKLEQLRALENGWRILAHEAKTHARGIDTPSDLEAARARFP